ncbi:aminotransferase [Homalodisca vitripennis]|nr:aminotransferase [Homalodisca vitripennis]
MAGFVLEIKFKDTQSSLTVEKSTSIRCLKEKLSEITNIVVERLQVLSGSPPRPLDLSLEEKTLLEVNINSGDKLIIEEQDIVTSVREDVSASALADKPCEEEVEPYVPWPVLLRKAIPGDNSCLFTSIGFILQGYVDASVGAHMRQLIAVEIAKDPDTYNEAFLGLPNPDYCTWILKPESWGGGIELAILSEFYMLEIVVVDTTNGILNRFGEDKSYSNRMFLIYDGCHYDALYMAPLETRGSQTVVRVPPGGTRDVARGYVSRTTPVCYYVPADAREISGCAKSEGSFVLTSGYITDALHLLVSLYEDGNTVGEDMRQNLPSHTNADEIFGKLDTFIRENELNWENV